MDFFCVYTIIILCWFADKYLNVQFCFETVLTVFTIMIHCPSACGRLATAAIFISIGIVQIIAAIILLKSKFAYMLSGPNSWTAISNISVGVVLGVAATVWKNIDKNSKKHANRRKFLAALVGSVFILNSTTAAMFIVGEGNNLLAIYLESGGIYDNKTYKDEILAYAYSASVCSTIVCVVISITFLTGICFRPKRKTIKTLEFKNIVNADDSQLYDWVYTSNLPKPDPEILKSALSSESESSSTESESDSSSDLPVPLHLRSRPSLSDLKNSQQGSIRSSSLQFNSDKNGYLDDSVSPSFLKTRYIPRIKRSSIITTPVHSYDESVNSYRSVSSGRRSMPTMVAYNSNCKPGTPVRIISSHAFEKSTYSPNFLFNTTLSPSPKGRLSFSPLNQGAASKLQAMKKPRLVDRDEPSTSRQSFMEYSTECEDSTLDATDLPPKRNIYTPNPHSKICRTSTTDQNKVQSDLENLDNSAIQFDAGVTAFKELYMDETLPEVNDKEKFISSSCLTDSAIEEKNDCFRTKGDLSIIVRNSNFRKKLSSRLVPAEGPVVSDGCSFYKTSNRRSIRSGRMKPYSKSKNGYDKYLQTGFSSFKNRVQVDEVDTMTHSTKPISDINKSPMTSISERPTEEDSFQPSTSSHTSGYLSASYEESEDETDLKNNQCPAFSKRQHSPAQKLIADEIKERYRKRSEQASFELDNDR